MRAPHLTSGPKTVVGTVTGTASIHTASVAVRAQESERRVPGPAATATRVGHTAPETRKMRAPSRRTVVLGTILQRALPRGQRKASADAAAQRGERGPPQIGQSQAEVKCRKGAGGSPSTAPSPHGTAGFPRKPGAATDPWIGATVTLRARNWPQGHRPMEGSGAELQGAGGLSAGGWGPGASHRA